MLNTLTFFLHKNIKYDKLRLYFCYFFDRFAYYICNKEVLSMADTSKFSEEMDIEVLIGRVRALESLVGTYKEQLATSEQQLASLQQNYAKLRDAYIATVEANKKLSSRLQATCQKLEEVSLENLTDGLTGVYNKKVYERLLSDKNSVYGVIVCDVDKFKDFNDSCGHSIGDEVLRHIGGVLKSSVRSDDYAIRIGGDEFVILLKGADLESACRKAASICEKVMRYYNDVLLTMSFGVAECDGDLELAFEKADKALYNSKHNGRNTVSFYDTRKGDSPDVVYEGNCSVYVPQENFGAIDGIDTFVDCIPLFKKIESLSVSPDAKPTFYVPKTSNYGQIVKK